jgi:hypothetical protein
MVWCHFSQSHEELCILFLDLLQEHFSFKLIFLSTVAGHEIDGNEVKLYIYGFQPASQGADVVIIEIGFSHASSEEEDALVVLLLSAVIIQLSCGEANCTEDVSACSGRIEPSIP